MFKLTHKRRGTMSDMWVVMWVACPSCITHVLCTFDRG